jgi:DNA gyrase subunit A
MVAHQEVVVSLSTRGFIKRLPLSTYRAQRRGGVGIIGMKTRENDAVRHLVVADTHDKLIFFTDRGRCFQVRTYEVTDESRQARGEAIAQLLPSIDPKERVTAVVRIPPEAEHDFMVMATRLGEVKKTPMKGFANVRRDGLIAMDLEPSDEFVSAKLATDDDHVVLVTARGQSLKFAVRLLRSASRQSGGVRGIKLAAGDQVVSMDIAEPGKDILVVSVFGSGKRTPTDDYPLQGRGGQGVITFKTNPKTGELVTARTVDPEHELMLISEGGIILRTPVKHISQQGRSTQGVKLMDVGDDDRVAAVAVVDMRREFSDTESLPTGAVVKGAEPGPEKKGRGAKNGKDSPPKKKGK